MDEVIMEFQEWLSHRIEVHDRMVDASDFQIDREIYNAVAHELRNVKDKLRDLIKRKEKLDAESAKS